MSTISEHIFTRFYKSANPYIHRDRLSAFLEDMEYEQYIAVTYQKGRAIKVVLRKNHKTKNFLGLTPCMQPVKRCGEKDCAHTDRCDAYIETRGTRSDYRHEIRKTGT